VLLVDLPVDRAGFALDRLNHAVSFADRHLQIVQADQPARLHGGQGIGQTADFIIALDGIALGQIAFSHSAYHRLHLFQRRKDAHAQQNR